MKGITWLCLISFLVGCASSHLDQSSSHKKPLVPIENIDHVFEEIHDEELIDQLSVVGKLQKSEENTLGIRSKIYRIDDTYLEQILLSTDLLFDSGRTKVKYKSKKLITQLFERIKPNLEDQYLIVVGHTDSIGVADYNMGLSLERAMTVVALMESSQLPTERINTIAAGEQLPLYSNDSKVNRARNRRVELYLSKNRTLALNFLRQIRCPDEQCAQSDLSILAINRQFKLTERVIDAQFPHKIRIFSQKDNGSKIRNIKSFSVTIRTFKVDKNIRKVRLLKGKYLLPRKR